MELLRTPTVDMAPRCRNSLSALYVYRRVGSTAVLLRRVTAVIIDKR